MTRYFFYQSREDNGRARMDEKTASAIELKRDEGKTCFEPDIQFKIIITFRVMQTISSFSSEGI